MGYYSENFDGVKDRKESSNSNSTGDDSINGSIHYRQRQREKFGSSKNYLMKVLYELNLTLLSRADPYTNINELARQFAEDSGLSPYEVAIDFGFPSFTQFLHSDLAKDHVLLSVDAAGNTIYMPHDSEKSKHIRQTQAISQQAIVDHEQKVENRKVAKAMLPENRRSLLEGKRRLVKIVYDLGGENKPILYNDVQKEYLKRYEVSLAKEELRRLFQRTSIGKIFLTLMHEEFELFQVSGKDGLIGMKLKVPYDELLARFDEFEKSQEKFQQQKQKSYAHLPDRRRVGPKKAPLDLKVLKPILPSIFSTEADEFEDDIFGEAHSSSTGSCKPKFDI